MQCLRIAEIIGPLLREYFVESMYAEAFKRHNIIVVRECRGCGVFLSCSETEVAAQIERTGYVLRGFLWLC